MDFIPLHVKSDYSLGYGTASVETLVAKAAELGYRHLALTDLENLYGQVRFHRQCRLHGIEPITGIELRPRSLARRGVGSKEGRVVLLARDHSGYRSLCRIIARRSGAVAAGRSGDHRDPVPLVLRYWEGLFALSDDIVAIDRLAAGGFPKQMTGLLIPRSPREASEGQRIEAAARLGIKPVADLDCVFPDSDDHPLHLLQLAIRQGVLLREINGAGTESTERHLRPPREAAALFADLPEALAHAIEIGTSCRLDLDTGGWHGGGVSLDEVEAAALLRKRCERALSELPSPDPAWLQTGRERLERELEVFSSLGFSRFMLDVARILEYCKENGIPVAARGSAVSSLTLHILGGSPVDPIAQGLLFERFLHAGKSAWPDVDLDLPWHRRDEVIEFVYQHFGHDRVAMVAAHHTFRFRSALREGLKAWGARPALIENLSRVLPPEEPEPGEVDFLDLASAADTNLEEEPLRRYEKAPMLKEILPLIRRLVGRPRHIAAHPGGIVIDRRPLQDLLPLERAPKGVVITQYDLVAIAHLGFVKIDLLGNRCLSELEETLRTAAPGGELPLGRIPRGDSDTLALIDRAETIGCFQLESPAMRSLLASVPIRRQSDITAALALIRPGAASGEVKRTFVRRAPGKEPDRSSFPLLADRLRETHGLLLYEEDVMELLSRSGGISLAEADEFRRSIVKSGGETGVLADLQEHFMERVPAASGKPGLARARRAWANAARFAAYSFNKAHAASYAELAYLSAYTKVHFPLEFACAVINHHQGLNPLRVEVNEMLRRGTRVLGPDVNRSRHHSFCEAEQRDRAVRVGLDKVKGLSMRAVSELIAERGAHGEFQTLRELLERVGLNIRDLTALIYCGACDRLPPLSGEAYPFIHDAVLKALHGGTALRGIDGIHVLLPSGSRAQLQRIRMYQQLVRVRNELLYLEMNLTAHPMKLLRAEASRYRCVTVATAREAAPGSALRVAAVVAAMRRVPIRDGILQYLTLEDETGLMEAVVMPQRYRLWGERVTAPGPFVVEGVLRQREGAVHLEILQLAPFHERKKPYGRRM